MSTGKILVVDDDKDFAKSMAMLLRSKGYDVEVAHSGEEAVDKFSEQDFDITFMDVRMPGKSGVESFLELRKLQPAAQVMMMTAYTVEQILDQAIGAGALGIMNKPLDIDQVVKTIEAARPGGIILVADDDPDFVESLRQLLSKRNYSVLVATTGQEAVETILNDGVDVLILDLRLPILSGLEVYLELKKHGKVLPTIIVTGFAAEEAESIDLLREMSVAGCLHKPFDPEQLIQAIEALIKEHQ